jgi:hypothetical protein
LNDRIYFSRAIVYARKIDKKKVLPKGFDVHRTQFAKLDDGYFIIEQKWFPPSAKK